MMLRRDSRCTGFFFFFFCSNESRYRLKYLTRGFCGCVASRKMPDARHNRCRTQSFFNTTPQQFIKKYSVS